MEKEPDRDAPKNNEKDTEGLSAVELYRKLLKEHGMSSRKIKPPEGWSRVLFRR